MCNRKRGRQTTDTIYNIKCPIHQVTLQASNLINDIFVDTSCDNCNLAFAKLLYIFTAQYDYITDLLSRSIKNPLVKFELGKYVTLLHLVDTSYEIERNGFLYKKNNNYYTEEKLITYFDQVTDDNRYLYSIFYLKLHDEYNFIKCNDDVYLNALFTKTNIELSHMQHIVINEKNLNVSIYGFNDIIFKFDAIITIYELFVKKVSNFLNEFSENVYYNNLSFEEQQKVCNYLCILDPFKQIKVATYVDSIINKKRMTQVLHYFDYFSFKEQHYCLQVCKQRKYQIPQIYDSFVIVNKKELHELLLDNNSNICVTKVSR